MKSIAKFSTLCIGEGGVIHMSITPDDKCSGCDRALFTYERTMTSCKKCGATYCEDCMEGIRKNNDICPSCGWNPHS